AGATTFWRQRAGAAMLEWAYALLFPCIGIAAAALGIEVVVDEAPLAGSTWAALAPLVVGAIPPLVVLIRWSEQAGTLPGVGRALAAEQRATLRERELEA